MDIVKRVGRSATPVVLEQAAKLLDVTEGTVERGLAAAVPGVLAALLAAARRTGIAGQLAAALAEAGGLAPLLSGHPAAAARRGSDLLSPLLDRDAPAALAGGVASRAGVPAAAAATLVGLAGAMTLTTLAEEAAAHGLDGQGVLDLLARERQAIAAALPAGIAIAAGGGSLAAAPPGRPAPVPPPAAKPRHALHWAFGLATLLLLGWLVLALLAPAPSPAPAPQAAPVAGPAADPLVVDGVDVGESVGAALASITASFHGITDAASARAALPRLIEARDRLNAVESAVIGLSDQGRADLKQMVTASLPAIRVAALRLKTDDGIADVVDPVVDDILAQLTVFAA